MKTLKKVPVELVEVEVMPEVMEFGKLYHSAKYRCTSHLCLCGCGVECFLPLAVDEWILTAGPTITPSILQRFACQSHYIITNGMANFV